MANFLAEFDFKMDYKPGKANVVVDAFSRKAEFAAIAASTPQSSFVEHIKDGLRQDKLALNLLKLTKEGKT